MYTKIKTIIVDDNPQSVSMLKYLLADFTEEFDLVGEAGTFRQAVELMNQSPFDLVFLDIELPGGTGFDILEQVKHKNFMVIFVTSHQQFAIHAIKANAVDYLLKPVSQSDFKMALDRIKARFVTSTETPAKLESISQRAALANTEKLSIPVVNGFKFLDYDEIVFAKADVNYTVFTLTDHSKIVSSKTIKAYEQILEKNGFFRIHKSYLIHLKYITAFTRSDGGTVTMNDGTEIPVSAQKRDAFLKLIQAI